MGASIFELRTEPGDTTAASHISLTIDSLWNTLSHRTKQMEILANLLHEPGCDGGLIAGDFNAIRPEDHNLLEKNGLEDAWLAVHGRNGASGTTWSVEVQRKGEPGLPYTHSGVLEPFASNF
ncbi:hypothetical protein AGABI1DRAFT_130512 [Agaricus bisporus var. burnettii JB137-S8]|uniref:Endonuclease/exonuclease/phosphatase domain-containing protein n=1 Tax=Agaricus bisporus var. burnettii (strain JB137-S8 / ATCC MYA-4627 / FGSC 10392) TaxID=597362 RepID=K5WPZ5_AGABU|nr:uncharacterized protein AGABI1DRAFT_130512 [Agaricus bisporus var. burnettii JB137-S8]EKM77431.1 hypothetical protein AGABI1DRAFT_130512 [Agaricus bisporus var. burnettii JB137-S8]